MNINKFKLVHVKTIKNTSSNKWVRFPKHSWNQELFAFVVARNTIDAKLFNPHSAVPDMLKKILA